MATKKMQSYRLNDETVEHIKFLAGMYRCSQAEVIESAFEILSNAALFDRLADEARASYARKHGGEESEPTMRALVRESYRL